MTKCYKTGQWYESKRQIRAKYGEYRKGILFNKKTDDLSIILNYRGAKRAHYEDHVDVDKTVIYYIGEGKQGDQVLNLRNRELVNRVADKKPLKVFFDCGDIFLPKHLLFMGEWLVESYKYIKINKYKKYFFKLVPFDKKIQMILEFQFGTMGRDKDFEKDLKYFAEKREHIYKRYPHILRARDSIAGQIGEYFAISTFNQKNKFPLIRLHESQRDIDAVQIKTGYRYAIKTIGQYPSVTSNIWSKNVTETVDYFIVVYLDKFTLFPKFIVQFSSKLASEIALKKDNYQNTNKIHVKKELLQKAKFLLGEKRDYC